VALPLAGFRKIQETDYPVVTTILNGFLSKYKLRPHFDEAEVRHALRPRPGVVYTYVVAGADGRATDVCSFYGVPTTVLNHDQHTVLHVAYMCDPAPTSSRSPPCVSGCVRVAVRVCSFELSHARAMRATAWSRIPACMPA
jgi:Myristoyl-CoA:protein N-myristoyltransferase, C-terminal domain